MNSNNFIKCPICKESVSIDQIICPACNSNIYDFLVTHNGKCIVCKGDIEKDAIKCKHCGEWQAPFYRKKAVNKINEESDYLRLGDENNGIRILPSQYNKDPDFDSDELFDVHKEGDNAYVFTTTLIEYKTDYSTVDCLTQTVWVFIYYINSANNKVRRKFPYQRVKLTKKDLELYCPR